MSLRVWLPLTKDLRNQGLDDVTVTNYGATLDNNGKLGKCYYFDGTDDRITVSGLSLPNVWSYGCWIYSATSSRGWEAVIMLNSTGGDSDLQLGFYTYPSGNRIQNTANGQYNSNIAWTYGIWHHFCGTFDGSNLKTYIDGILIDTKAITASLLSRTNLTIGARSTNAANTTAGIFFQGRLNDIRIYDHCLSPMEVKLISQGLVLHYPLNRQGWGQENLFLNSGDLTLWSKESGVSIIWDSTEQMYKITDSHSGTQSRWGIYQNFSVTPNTTYTLTIEGKKGQKTTGVGIATYESSATWPGNVYSFTTEKTKKIYTFTSGSNHTIGRIYLAIVPGDTVTNDGWFNKPKLEVGNKATPWCPNSADELATTMGLNGTTEYDCSGFCNNGTRTGTFTWTSDTPKYQVSTSLNNNTSKLHISGLSTSGFGNSYSIAWWGKTNSFSGLMQWGFSDGIRLNGIFNGNLWNTGDSANNPLYVPGTTTQVSVPTTNEWHHFVMVGDGSTSKVYKDGELWGQAKTYKAISGTSIYFNGWDTSTSYSNNNGYSMSDFRIYATALSADDVKSLYQNSAYIDSSGNVYGAVHTEV